MPVISVIVPVYNASEYIEDCLQSICGQTYRDIEIICVNDGSKDNSLELIRRAASEDARIRVIDQKNSGVIAARNRAVSEACGEYILPVDGDDYIALDCLEKLLQVMKSEKYGVVYGQTMLFGYKNGIFELPLVTKKGMVKYNSVVCTGMFRKSDWEKYGGYDENMRDGWEDWEFWLNFVEDNQEFCRIEDVCLYYRKKEGTRNNTISKPTRKKLKKYIRKKHAKLYEEACPNLWQRLGKKVRRCFGHA